MTTADCQWLYLDCIVVVEKVVRNHTTSLVYLDRIEDILQVIQGCMRECLHIFCESKSHKLIKIRRIYAGNGF